MLQFFQDMPHNPFLLRGLLVGLLASVACGIMGPYVITRRIVFLAGAIAHMAVGGIGAAIFLRHYLPDVFSWLTPSHGALAAALSSAIVIGLIYERVAERMDTLIGAMWAIGMSIGILLLKFTPGYHAELMSYLFGNISLVSESQVWLLAVLNVIILVIVLALHKRFLSICVDEEQAALQGVNVLLTNLILLCAIALAVISLMQVVGLILVLALLTLPAATAGHHLNRMLPIMLVAVGLNMLLTTMPRVAVYGSNVSPESAIVLAAGAMYLVSTLLRGRARGSAHV